MAFAAKHDASTSYKGQKKDCPYCTHCQYHAHTVDKCYKLHGYPSGFKQRNNGPPITQSGHKSQSGPTGHNHFVAVNQFSTSPIEDTVDKDTSPIGSFFQQLINTQCQQLMSLLSNHLVSNVSA